MEKIKIITDSTLDLPAELIREKVLHYIHDEVPHGVAVEIERMKSFQIDMTKLSRSKKSAEKTKPIKL